MKQITSTTDGRFVGRLIDIDKPIILDGFIFVPDKVQHYGELCRLSNSSYVIDTKDVE